jgi:hypothetical protein
MLNSRLTITMPPTRGNIAGAAKHLHSRGGLTIVSIVLRPHFASECLPAEVWDLTGTGRVVALPHDSSVSVVFFPRDPVPLVAVCLRWTYKVDRECPQNVRRETVEHYGLIMFRERSRAN